MAQDAGTKSKPPDTTSKPKPPDTTSDIIRNVRSYNYKDMSWIEATKHGTAAESRVQPWKQTFGNMIDPTKDGEDIIVMRGDDEVQHSGGAGA
jgi:hypothetical protein